jgi:hypothetical protein
MMRSTYILLAVALVVALIVGYYVVRPSSHGEYFSAAPLQFPSRFLIVNKSFGLALRGVERDLPVENYVTMGDVLRGSQFSADVNSDGRVCFRLVSTPELSLVWVPNNSGGGYNPGPTPSDGPGGDPDDPPIVAGAVAGAGDDIAPLILSQTWGTVPSNGTLPLQYFIISGTLDNFQITYPAGQATGGFSYPTPQTNMSIYCDKYLGCAGRSSAGDSFAAIDMSLPLPPAFFLQTQDGYFQSDTANLSITQNRKDASPFYPLSDGTVAVGDDQHWLQRVTDGFTKQTVVTSKHSHATAYEFTYRAPLTNTTRAYTIREIGSGEYLVASGEAIGENGDIDKATLFTVDLGCSDVLGVTCPPDASLCDHSTGTCSPPTNPYCSSDADCTPGYVCDTGRRNCVPDGG